MLLLDDGIHFICNLIAATKFDKAFHPMRLPWLHRMYLQVQSHTQVFLDSVIQPVTVRQSFQRQFIRQQRSTSNTMGMQLGKNLL